MLRHIFLRRAAVFGAVAPAGLFALLPARAQTPGLIVTPAALPSSATAPRPPACTVAAEQVRFDRPLPRTARRLVSGEPIKIVALGSSSTFGAGASGLIHSGDSQMARSSSSSRHESRNCRQRHPSGPPSTSGDRLGS